MTNEQLNTALYKKMFAEQQEVIDELHKLIKLRADRDTR